MRTLATIVLFFVGIALIVVNFPYWPWQESLYTNLSTAIGLYVLAGALLMLQGLCVDISSWWEDGDDAERAENRILLFKEHVGAFFFVFCVVFAVLHFICLVIGEPFWYGREMKTSGRYR